MADQRVRLAKPVAGLAVSEAGEVEAGGGLAGAAELERHFPRAEGGFALAEAVAFAGEQVAGGTEVGACRVVVVALGHERAKPEEGPRLLAPILGLLEDVVRAGVA